MLILSLSVATNSLNDEVEVTNLDETSESLNVILPASQLNEPGFQEGSIFTDTTLSSGSYHTCAVLDDESVSCWGNNSVGQLGDGTTTEHYTPNQTSSLGTGRTAVAISSGHIHTCAILDDGSVSCWGVNSNGLLGDGTTTERHSPTQTSSLGTNRTAVAISSGRAHTCAILDDASVSCWGFNYHGQLGDGTTTDRNTPTQTSSLGIGRTAVAISSGQYHTCAILDDASVSCWGINNLGQLGDDTLTNRNKPTQTSSLGTGKTAIAISSGGAHTCAILDDGTVSCWGYNGEGGLGDGTTTDRNKPTQTSSLGTERTAVAISSGNGHTCALLDDASVSCWGSNYNGGLGDGTTADRYTPTQTSSLGTGRTAVAISSGYHTCAILDDAAVSCWGSNWKGQLGDGTNTDRNTPTQISSLGTTTNPRTAALSERDFDGDGILNIFDAHQSLEAENTISSGGTHTCAILDNGTVSCWGRNTYGQLGDGTTIDRSTPTQTSSLGTNRTAVAISSGQYHTCAILDDASVSCWGRNYYGLLGNGTTTDRNTPTQTSSLGTGRTAVAISSGRAHTCAILDDATVSCWGHNVNGQLGDGTTIDRSTPTQTSSLGTNRTAVAISSGQYHTCAILDDASVSCWGFNYYGQLGDGTTTDRNTPTQTLSFETGRTAVAISSGPTHNCAILDDASVSCWGFNANGQLGDGTTTQRYTPTPTSSLGTGRTAVAISSGDGSNCAILDDASVSCWGYNGYGQLGDGTTTQRYTPTPTSNLGTNRTAVAISSGYTHTCALLDDASLSCWGYNDAGQLGDGTATQRNTPTPTLSFSFGRTVLLVDADSDGDGVSDDDDDFASNPIRSIACTSGQYGRYLCVDSPVGKYVPSSSAMYATNCALGTYQATTGQSSCDDADAGYYVSTTAQSDQTECGLGTYQVLTSQSFCDDADAGYYVNQTTQTTQTECDLGTYQALTGQSSCNNTDAGYYVNQTTQTIQTECGLGTYQALTGQSSCDDADYGYYVNQTTQTTQTECSIGTYQVLTGQSSCDDTNAGYYVATTAQTNQTECSIGTYQTWTGQGYCNDADAGYYVNQTTQTNQTKCAIGTYQSLTGQGSCNDADAGYYVDQTTQTIQIECGLGTYQVLTGQSSCDDADAGYYVDKTTQTNQTECGLGTYQALTGQTSCDKANTGYYVDSIGAEEEIPCPNLKSTIGNYSVSESDCLLDIDSDLIPDIIDNDDDNDGINDTADRFPKDVNEWNDSDLDGVGDNEDTDDDNDGWSDVEEIRAGTDPYSNSDQPIEGFEIIIPGTSISLGAWDLIGMLGGIPLFVWVSFGFITRNSRSLKFETRMKEAKNKDELDKISGKVELSLTVRLLGVNQGIRLDKLRTDLEESFSSNQANNGDNFTKVVPVISNLNIAPDAATPADQVDAEGYEWLTHSDGSKWYRVAQSNTEWIEFE